MSTPKTETLHDCPHCARTNFTARGFKEHLRVRHAAQAMSGGDANAPKREPLTLARLDAMPPVATHSVALKDLTVPQLGEAFRGLDAAQENYSKLSGICATMKGLVLTEVKAKVGHGKFIPWLKEHFPIHRATAAKHMRLAEEFGKCSPTATFELLTHDLASSLEAATNHHLDLGNPLVSRVSAWVGNRSAYQLELELKPACKGGDTRKPCPHCAALLKSTIGTCPKCGKVMEAYDPNAAVEIARSLLLHAIRDVWTRWHEKEAKLQLWAHLPPEELREIDGILLDLRTQLKAALKDSAAK